MLLLYTQETVSNTTKLKLCFPTCLWPHSGAAPLGVAASAASKARLLLGLPRSLSGVPSTLSELGVLLSFGRVSSSAAALPRLPGEMPPSSDACGPGEAF